MHTDDLRNSASVVAEKFGNRLACNQMREAADEIDRLRKYEEWAKRARKWAMSFHFHYPHLVPEELLNDWPGGE